MKIVIFAGGKGTRLWPLSRTGLPKQFLSFGEGKSLLQKAILRFLPIGGASSIVVITSAESAPLVQSQCLEIDPSGGIFVLVEPCSRSTAPALCLALRFLEESRRLGLDESVLAAPSDALFFPEEPFLESLYQAEEGVKKGAIALFGVSPTRPETGYGYLQIGEPFEGGFKVSEFIEKPLKDRAKALLQAGSVFWNLGHLLCSPDVFWQEVKEHCPKLLPLRELSFEALRQELQAFPAMSIEHALLEKSDTLVVYPVHTSWSDIGSWDGLYEILEKDESGNVKRGDVIARESENCLFLSEKRLIAAVGVKDICVIETQEAILVSQKGNSEKVKDLVEQEERHLSSIFEKKESYQMQTIQIGIHQRRSVPKHMLCQKRFVVLKGMAQIKIREELFLLQENETLSLASGSEAMIENVGKEPLEILEVEFQELGALC